MHSLQIAYETFTKTHHPLGHETNFSKYKSSKLMQSMLPEHKKIKININRKISGKSLNIWNLIFKTPCF